MSLRVHEDHRLQQLSLRSVMLRELLRIYPRLDVRRLEETYDQWFPLALSIVQEHHGYAASLARRYVDEARDEAGVTDTWTPPPDRTLNQKRLELAMYKATIVQMKAAIAKAKSEKEAYERGFVTSSGVASTAVLDGARDVVVDSVDTDAKAVGWFRVTDGDPCYFCAMLAARGVRYKTKTTASFKAHDHCGCEAAPAYSRDQELPAISGEASDLYDRVTKKVTGKDKILAFRRAWEARHPPVRTDR